MLCWWETGWPWQALAEEGLARPCREQELLPTLPLSPSVSSSQSLLEGSHSPFPLISAYLLPFTCFQTEPSPFLWFCPGPVPTTFPSSPFHLHVLSSPLGTVFGDVSVKPLRLHHSFSPFWMKKKNNLPGLFWI